MLGNLYPFWAALTANILAQSLKPIIRYLTTGRWESRLALDSGGFPSSHTSTVSALSLAVGLHERFSSTLFAVTLVFSLIVMYDAANVRYYAGRNIQLTKQLIHDLQALSILKLDDPIYLLKIKDVLGHQWIEVFGGCFLGLVIASLMYFLR